MRSSKTTRKEHLYHRLKRRESARLCAMSFVYTYAHELILKGFGLVLQVCDGNSRSICRKGTYWRRCTRADLCVAKASEPMQDAARDVARSLGPRVFQIC